MKKACIALIPAFFVVAWAASLPAISHAQREKFIISAKAGGVNAVTGRATVRGHGNAEEQQLTIKEDLEAGDIVKTGTDGRVEMLLNPGSYLRLGENSEFELADNSPENLEVRLIRGTAVVEATGADNVEMLINITTPHTKLAIVQRGLYRLSVVPGDNTELIVRKGRVMLDKSHTKIKGGNKVVFSSDSFFVAKLTNAEKKKLDGLDQWSKDRAETVAQANRRIRGRDISMMMRTLSDDWFFRSFSAANNGLWWFNPRFNCYTFVPFYWGWGSPYGSSYSNAFFPGYYCCSGRGNGGRLNPYPTTAGGYPSGSVSAPSGGGSTNPAPMPPPMSPPPSSRPNPPALEGRILRHQDRPNQ